MPSPTDRAWSLWEVLIRKEASTENPWKMLGSEVVFEPDVALLKRLLAVPLLLGSPSQSGLPAKAVDVWVAQELRRAGFGSEIVWPRLEAPRVVARDVLALLASAPKRAGAAADWARLFQARMGSADARILGRNYFKQVDVVISHWSTGPELLVSTKRMDSSFSKNAYNRVEEAYGDAKNLRGRHPLAALGFVFVMRSTVLKEEHEAYLMIADLLQKLGRDEDAYDATALILPRWTDADEALLSEDIDAESALASLADVELEPPSLVSEIGVDRFFRIMIERVLANSPVTEHRAARDLRAAAAGSPSV